MNLQSLSKEHLVRELASARRVIADLEGQIEGLKKKKGDLYEREERYHLYFSLTDDVMFTYDNTFRILSVSPNVERVSGYTPYDLIGKTFQELGIMDPEDMEEALDNALHVLSGRILPSSIYRFTTKNGKRKFFEVTGVPYIQDGEVRGVISVGRDITERLELERSLQESLETARMLLDSSSDSMILLDTEGTVIALNESAALQFGSTMKDMLGTSVYSHMAEGIAKRRKKHVEEIIRSGKPVRQTETRKGKSYMIKLHPLVDLEETVARIVVIGREITRRAE
ncbi:MAG: PAS domain-containing protein [Desulfomonilia bacterium]